MSHQQQQRSVRTSTSSRPIGIAAGAIHLARASQSDFDFDSDSEAEVDEDETAPATGIYGQPILGSNMSQMESAYDSDREYQADLVFGLPHPDSAYGSESHSQTNPRSSLPHLNGNDDHEFGSDNARLFPNDHYRTHGNNVNTSTRGRWANEHSYEHGFVSEEESDIEAELRVVSTPRRSPRRRDDRGMSSRNLVRSSRNASAALRRQGQQLRDDMLLEAARADVARAANLGRSLRGREVASGAASDDLNEYTEEDDRDADEGMEELFGRAPVDSPEEMEDGHVEEGMLDQFGSYFDGGRREGAGTVSSS